jgi:hypothetical protein
VAQVIECLPSKQETKKIKKQTNKQTMGDKSAKNMQ